MLAQTCHRLQSCSQRCSQPGTWEAKRRNKKWSKTARSRFQAGREGPLAWSSGLGRSLRSAMASSLPGTRRLAGECSQVGTNQRKIFTCKSKQSKEGGSLIVKADIRRDTNTIQAERA